ncbi:TPA: hypothetical protein O7142_000928 [Salmonella enterica]|nr:hypothetical protein [Salmonella enterica subsp. diarizonae]EEI1035295.1 hypothetical protein [Salmonella enterica]EEP1426375.1 hypothetical protein [Salmonella enterica]HDC2658581.1 hypothetical protein [Salmonella enterica]
MERFLAGVFLFISFGATAECWVVGDMHGISYSERNNFQPEEDGFSGSFIIKTNGEDASITYSGANAGGMAYKTLSENSIIGIGANGETQRVVDSWVIHPNGAVLMSKTISGYGKMDSTKAFVGKVKRKC